MPLSEAGSKLLEWRNNPRQFVGEVFGVTPDAWQADVLDAFPHNQRQAMKACKGPGKTAVLAWIGLNFMATRYRAKGAAISISRENLRDNLWAELSKWQARSRLLSTCFTHTQSQITNNEAPLESFLSARAYPRSASKDDQSNALAGLHADNIIFLIDEAGGVPVPVLATAEAALTGAENANLLEAHILMAGNPTDLNCALHFAAVLNRGSWWTISITADPDDPKRTPRVTKEWAREQIKMFGRDNPWVRINVFGEFPPSALNTLLGPDVIEAAFKRRYHEPELRMHARVAGVDVARFGDDASVFFPRRGPQAGEPKLWRNVDSVFGAGAVAREWQVQSLDAVFVDNTGGYGAGWIDQLKVLGRSPIPVGFATEANDPRYFNKRAEIYFEAAEWFKAGGAMAPCPEILAAMTQTTYTFKGDKLLLEPKELVKVKLGYSPDHADAFAMTFAQPVVSAAASKARGPVGQMKIDYDPFAGMRDDDGAAQVQNDYEHRY